jgi:hypothetical protein
VRLGKTSTRISVGKVTGTLTLALQDCPAVLLIKNRVVTRVQTFHQVILRFSLGITIFVLTANTTQIRRAIQGFVSGMGIMSIGHPRVT